MFISFAYYLIRLFYFTGEFESSSVVLEREVACEHFLSLCSLSSHGLHRVFHKANILN